MAKVRSGRDTAIDLETPDENIEVSKAGRFYPEDFSDRINMESRKQAVLGEIPKSLAGIADSYNDYKINEYTTDQDLALKQQEMQNNIELEEYKQELELRAKNAAFDRFMLFESEADAAKKEAELNPDASLTEAYQQIVDTYKNDPDLQGAGPQFQAVFNGLLNHAEQYRMNEARKFDLGKEQAKLANNIGVLSSHINADVLAGTLGYREGFERFLTEAGPMYAGMPWEKRNVDMHLKYNQFVQTQVLTIIEQVQAGTKKAKAAQDELRGILDSTKQDSFQLFEPDGTTPLKDKEGNDVFFTPMLDPSVQQLCVKALKDAGNSGGIKDRTVSNIIEELSQKYDVTTIKEQGYSAKLASESYPQLQGDLKAAWTDVLALNPTTEQVRDLTTIGNNLGILKVLSDVASTDKNAIYNIAVGLGEAIAKLEKDLVDPSVDWGNYKLKVGDIDFTNIVLDYADEYSHLGDKRNTYKLVYSDLKDQLIKFRDLGDQSNKGNILAVVSAEYQQAVNPLEASINPATLLLEDADGTIRFRDKEGDNQIWRLAKQAEKVSMVSIRKGLPPTLPDSFFTGLEGKFDRAGFKSREKQWMGSLAVMRILRHAGLNQSLYNYIANHPKENDKVLRMLAAADLYVNDDGTIDTTGYDIQKHMQGLGAVSNESSKEAYAKQMGGTTEGALVKQAIDASSVKDLPKSAEIILGAHVEDLASMIFDNGGKLVDVKAQLTSIINKRYVNIKGVDTAVPRSSRIIQYKGELFAKNKIPEMAKKINRSLDPLGAGNKVVSLAYNDKVGDLVFKVGDEVLKDRKGTPLTLWFPTDKNADMGIVSEINRVRFLAVAANGNEEIFKHFANQASIKHVDDSKKRQVFAGLAQVFTDDVRLHKMLIKGEAQMMTIAPMQGGVNASSLFTQTPSSTYMSDVPDYMYQSPLNYSPSDFSPIDERAERENKSQAEDEVSDIIDVFSSPNNKHFGNRYYLEDAVLEEVEKLDLSYVDALNTYVGKINQADISVPLSHAAVGNPSYMDAYSTATAMGFTIDAAPLAGVTLDLPELPDTIQTESPEASMHFATEPMALGTATEIPKPTGKKYTPKEIDAKVGAYAIQHGVDTNIIRAMVTQESGWKTKAVSKKGAQGLMQLMPATAKSLGVTDPYDVDQNLWAGIKYFKMQLDRFDGNVELALAAYNAGPGAVKKYGGIPPYKETQNYVKKITAGIKKRGGVDKDHYLVKFSIGSNEYQLMDTDTGGLSRKGINNFVHLIQNAAGYKGKVQRIYTSSPELLEDSPENADFKEYRSLKGPDGKPLFAKGNYDGFVLEMKRDKPLELDAAAFDTIASDMVNTQYTGLPATDNEQAQALLTAVADRYDNSELKNFVSFGLANLTAQEYREYGVPDEAMDNPILQARVLNQEFQRAQDILGSERKAIYAISGGTLAEKNGERKTWAEIKKDKEAYLKEWFIKPELDDTIRNKVNQTVATYDAEYRRLRGV